MSHRAKEGLVAAFVRRLMAGPWTALQVLGSSVASVVLIRWAYSWDQGYRDRVAASYDATAHIWRWFVAAALLVIAGVLIGQAVRRRGFSGRFDWRATSALGIVPLVLAMTFPAFVWQWPGSSHGSPLWRFRSDFVSYGLDRSMWILVGLAIVAGLRSRGS